MSPQAAKLYHDPSLPDVGRDETLVTEYRIYLECADDGTGKDITSGEDLLTFDEWLES